MPREEVCQGQMKRIAAIGLGCYCVVFALLDRAQADAIVVTKAMEATTIAEVFLEPGEVRVELEIGADDVGAFHSLLPEEFAESDSAERVTDGWAVLGEDGEPLQGRVALAERGHRIIRDEITGEPLPVQPEDAEGVVSLVLAYGLEDQPATLSFRPPMRDEGRYAAANVGFIVYDRGIPVNDFRYLSRVETLDLDWEDPWYSRFRNRNLVRQYDAPLSVFVYVEHFEVRQEVVLRPRDLQQWVDLGLEGKTTIPVSDQEELKQRVAEFLLEHNPLTIDGRVADRRLDRMNFIRRSLRQTGVVDPPEEMDLDSATLGVIFVTSVEELPESVEMTWELFGPKIQKIPAVATDEAGGLPATISEDNPDLVWTNYLTNPTVPAIAAIPTPPAMPTVSLSWLGLTSLAVALLFLVRTAVLKRRGDSHARRHLIGAGIGVVAAVLFWPLTQVSISRPFSEPPSLTAGESSGVLAGLLHNIYRAFDRRDESVVYDRLARSIDGDLLTDVYIQTRKSMELENQGGARVKVTEVELLEAEAESTQEDGGFVCRCRWNVSGSVGHWGHVHQRTNQYAALLTVRPIDDVWKITQLEILDEQRVDAGAVRLGG